MSLLIFCVICALILLFYKIRKLSCKIDSLESDIAKLLSGRISAADSSKSGRDDRFFATRDSAAMPESGAAVFRPLKSYMAETSNDEPKASSSGGPQNSPAGLAAHSPHCAHGMSASAEAVHFEESTPDSSAAPAYTALSGAQPVSSAVSEAGFSPKHRIGQTADRHESGPSDFPKQNKGFESVQWDIDVGDKVEHFRFVEFLRKYVAANSLLWIGALSLALSGIFLAKYSIERGLLTPIMRLLGAAIMAVALFAAGEFALRKFANKMMAGLLVGAGIIVAYGDLCAAAQLYSILPIWSALLGMALLSVLAYALKARYGAGMFYLAIMGLFLAPAITYGDSPSTLLLVCYLSISTAACAYAAVRQNCVPALLFVIACNICWILFWHVCALINLSCGFDINNYLYIFAYMLFYSWVVIFARARIKFSDFYAKAADFFSGIGGIDTISFIAFLKAFIRDSALIFSAFVFLFDFLSLNALPDMSIAFFLIFAYCLLWRMRGVVAAIFVGIFCSFGMSCALCHADADLVSICSACAILIPIAVGIFFSGKLRAARLGSILTALIFVCTISGLSRFRLDFAYKFALLAVCAALVVAVYIGLFKNARKYGNLRGACLFLGVFSIILFSNRLESNSLYIFNFCVLPYFAIAAGAVAAFIKTRDWALRNAAMSMQTFLILLLLALVFAPWISPDFYGWNFRIAPKFILISAVSLGSLAYFAKNSKGYSKIFEFFGMASSICFVLGVAFYLPRLIYSCHDDSLPLEAKILAFSLASLASIPVFSLSRRAAFSGMGAGAYVAAFVVGLIVLHCFSNIFSARISGWFVANTLTVSMLSLAAAYFVLARLAKNRNLRILLSSLALLVVFLWANSQVRFYFHPNILGGAMGDIEFYSYSVLWMFTGLASLVLGRLGKSACLEYASVLFVLAAVFKVFFFDVSELGGLLRVASFGLLGIILFGIGTFYARFVFNRN